MSTQESMNARWYKHQIKVLEKEIENDEKKRAIGKTLLTEQDINKKRDTVEKYKQALQDIVSNLWA